MTPADRRITELIDKWLASVDLHLKYAELSDAAYSRAQPWPKHDRPTRWVLEVARQKILELKSHCETRQAMGDSRFAESLELMAFLANLVGIQHIQRFVPLAEPGRENTSSTMSQTVEAPFIQKVQAAARARPATDESTREMPRLRVPAVAKAAPTAAPKAAEPKAPEPKPVVRPTPGARPAAPAAAAAPAKAPAPKPAAAADLKEKMLADAVRLLKWGKPWHELAELIGRIADRPSVPDIRKFLRANKAEIEARAAKSN
ncbi:hypothetical protein HNQ60_000296 [Povalibacter uvarum]|uniref:Uncharacterized protein n=1 Tax=Povalibacter uvarum TaxID=732238 RepID=A0A841HGH7_9GAMM|nr:hypothetical protein [Povalibacter uvarum]MBB6091450.1 hypothetical protein [Povalibacter uvarum]